MDEDSSALDTGASESLVPPYMRGSFSVSPSLSFQSALDDVASNIRQALSPGAREERVGEGNCWAGQGGCCRGAYRGQGLIDSARHVMKRISSTRLLSYTAFYDVAIHPMTWRALSISCVGEFHIWGPQIRPNPSESDSLPNPSESGTRFCRVKMPIQNVKYYKISPCGAARDPPESVRI